MRVCFGSTSFVAAVSAILLYGILGIFVIVYFFEIPWSRSYTIALYGGTTVATLYVALHHFRREFPRYNVLDLLFCLFLSSVIISLVINWWNGDVYILELMPAFFLAPYILGRNINRYDLIALRQIILYMGIFLLYPLSLEYIHTLKYGPKYINSPTPYIFGQQHGVMLSGLLLSAALVSLVSLLLLPNRQYKSKYFGSYWISNFGYVMLSVFVIVIGWVSSRSGCLVGFSGVCIVILLAPKIMKKEKIKILVFLSIGIIVAILQSLQWKENRDFYAQVISSPPSVDQSEGRSNGTVNSIELNRPILGSKSCALITDSVTDRWMHYKQALEIFIAKPYFGVGANMYGNYACTGPGSFPHSTILQVFSELGTIVGLIYCIILFLIIYLCLGMYLKAENLTDSNIWSWFIAFTIMQFIIAQLSGNYFMSVSIYFIAGVAAKILQELSFFQRYEVK